MKIGKRFQVQNTLKSRQVRETAEIFVETYRQVLLKSAQSFFDHVIVPLQKKHNQEESLRSDWIADHNFSFLQCVLSIYSNYLKAQDFIDDADSMGQDEEFSISGYQQYGDLQVSQHLSATFGHLKTSVITGRSIHNNKS